IAVLLTFVFALRVMFRGIRTERTPVFLAIELVLVVVSFLTPFLPKPAAVPIHWLFFPPDMVFLVAVAAIFGWWSFLRSPDRNLSVPLLFTFSAVLAFRILMGMQPTSYAIYYNQPTVLCFLLLVSRLILPKSHRSPAFVHQAQVLACFGCLLVASVDCN